MSKTTVFWFRRDLRLKDNAGLFHAVSEKGGVLPLFIFDRDILDALEDEDDARVQFIHETVADLKSQLRKKNSDLWIREGRALDVFKKLTDEYDIGAVYTNRDDDPQALKRDQTIEKFLKSKKIEFKTFKDQSLFERDEILTDAGRPYTVFTPYKRKVLATLKPEHLKSYPSETKLDLHKGRDRQKMPSLKDLGFKPSAIKVPKPKISKAMISDYDKTRDFPAVKSGTTHLGTHLRFGTISIRELARFSQKLNAIFFSELIWRDFFMQILANYPHVVKGSFRPEYDRIAWRKSKTEFRKWCEGRTGYPMVDAGMRELNATGFMHNRVRMVTASFLTKHLLMSWQDGERYFARKLLDYDLAANNGNWQWAAGTGCDAAPYFRIFNPAAQMKRFDRDGEYVKKWVPEYGTAKYVKPMIDHDQARGRALSEYSRGLKGLK